MSHDHRFGAGRAPAPEQTPGPHRGFSRNGGSGRPALECHGLAKQFGGVPAVDGLDLTVLSGEVVALLGPSGCGKTTALRLIAGFEMPDAGTISVAGREVCRAEFSVPPEQRRVAMVFQEGALFPHMTVEQNVAYGLARGNGRAQRVNEVLAMVGLDGLRGRMPHELSGGQQQRVALARALAPRPEILLLDEPFSNLDPRLREQVRRDVLEIIRRSNVTAVFVTHDQEEALQVGDSIAVMRQGRIEQTDSPEGIFHSPATRFVAQFIGMVDFIPAWREGAKLMTEVGSIAWPQPAADLSPESGNGAGAEVEVMVRPDCLECYPSELGQGTVIGREFHGSFYVYRVALPSGHSVRCLLSHIDDLPSGTAVAVGLRQGHALRPFIGGKAVSV